MGEKSRYAPRKGKRSVVLLSGGLDSAVVLAMEKAAGAKVFCLSVRYGQRNSLELIYAKRLAERYEVSDHRIVELDLSVIARSPLVGIGKIPCRTLEEIREGPSVAYVPARNTILLSLGLALCETMECDQLHIGACRDDENFVDCRLEFVIAWNGLGKCATNVPVTIQAPLLTWPKHMVVQMATAYGLPLEETFSCYQPVKGLHCGRCDACIIRRDAAEKAAENLGTGWTDPTEYVVEL